ncbi:RNA polymerase sigma factor RpoH [Alphaproteobacteria bacterium HT1-32]|nr:RNA polymerase sigma factor RpoH [Alphaproteobacteria bacterium HT1-32]
MSSINLPLVPDNGLNSYLQKIRAFPMLSKEEETALAERLRDEGDVEAAHKLVTSHLRLVAKIAFKFKNYGLPVSDLIAEGNIGLMTAVKKFDPDLGYRLSTYAMWWIRAAIGEFVLNSWSIVKTGSNAARKRLFFKLKGVKARLGMLDDRELSPLETRQIASELQVPEHEVTDLSRRMIGSDSSLNAPLSQDSEMQHIEMLEDDTPNPEEAYAASEELGYRSQMLKSAMDILNEREQDILVSRRLVEDPLTLEELGDRYGVSRERIRQIEVRAFEKLQHKMKESLALAAA